MNVAQNLVSVIITTRNSEKFFDKCLKSIIKQSYNNIEIIVVDNNSTDNTKEVARNFTNKVFNIGPERSAQRNFGAKKAKGEYLYFVDSDFVLDKRVVQQAIEKIAEGFDAVVVHNSPDTSVSWIAKVRKFEVDMYKYNLTHSAARFFKKTVFDDIGGYTESVTAGEDYDIQNKLNRNKFKTGFVEAEALHLGEPTSLIKHLMKYYIYGKDYVHFQERNKKESGKQLNIARGVYLMNWKKFANFPVMGTVFIIYSVLKFSFGGLGFLVGRIEKDR